MKEEILELLYRSFDSELTAEEQKRLERALVESEDLERERDRLARLRGVVGGGTHASFGPYFAERVLGRITSSESNGRESFVSSLVTVFRPVALAASLLAAVLTTVNLVQSKNKTVYTAFAGPEVTVQEALDPTLPLTLE
jgi:hypothetical protein